MENLSLGNLVGKLSEGELRQFYTKCWQRMTHLKISTSEYSSFQIELTSKAFPLLRSFKTNLQIKLEILENLKIIEIPSYDANLI
jgi:hypothetical protein